MKLNEETEKMYAAFGIEPPKDEGAKEQEIAEPAKDGDGDGDDGDNGAETETSSEAGKTEPTGKISMTAEERHRKAAERREAEREEDRKAARKEAEAEFDKRLAAFCKAAGLKNTLDDSEFKSLSDMEKWQEDYKRKSAEQQIEDGKLSKEAIDTLIDEHPAVKEAKALTERNKKEAEQKKQAEFEDRVKAEFAEIAQIDPDIDSLGAALSMPWASKFTVYVKMGLSFIDAYRLCNPDKIAAFTEKKTREHDESQRRSKEHIKTTVDPKGSGAKTVPKDVLKTYQFLFPGKSDSEISAMYNNNYKE